MGVKYYGYFIHPFDCIKITNFPIRNSIVSFWKFGSSLYYKSPRTLKASNPILLAKLFGRVTFVAIP